MQLRVRTLTYAVAVAALVLGATVHVNGLLRSENDFALPILLMELCISAIAIAIAAGIALVVRAVRKDEAYASQLRRRVARSPFSPEAAELDA
jgi:hypothetical protein